MINLLPVDLSPNKNLNNFVKYLKKIEIVGYVLLLIVLVGLISLFVINSFRLKSLQTKENELIASIKELSSTEQSFFLIKDRLGKIKTVLADESSGPAVDNLSQFISKIPLDITLTDIEITPKTTKITAGVGNSNSLTQFLATIYSTNDYKSVLLKSFGFNPNSGYSLTLEGANK